MTVIDHDDCNSFFATASLNQSADLFRMYRVSVSNL